MTKQEFTHQQCLVKLCKDFDNRTQQAKKGHVSQLFYDAFMADIDKAIAYAEKVCAWDTRKYLKQCKDDFPPVSF